MKLATQQIEIESYGISEQQDFSVEMNAYMASLLSDKTYSDKPLAVVRELYCNAWDSHVAAGTTDTPIEVTVPNPLNPTFSVKDFGLGLSHPDVMKLYSTYGASLKRQTNALIGGFGIGSKAPFAYVDQFTVISRFNGEKRIYSCYKGERGVPCIALLHTEATDEPNGVEVSIPVQQPQDYRVFKDKVRFVCRRFPTLPVIKGDPSLTLEPISYLIRGQGWGIRSTVEAQQADDISACAVVGNVAYRLESASIEGLSPSQMSVLGLPLDLFFEVGDVEVQASREVLSYDPQTTAVIKARLDEVVAAYGDEYKAMFAACKTRWEAEAKYREIRPGLTYQISRIVSPFLKWNNMSLGNRIYIDPGDFKKSDDPDGTVYPEFEKLREYNWDDSVQIRWGTSLRVEPGSPCWFVRADTSMYLLRRRVRHLLTTDTERRPIYIARTDSEAHWQKFLSLAGDPPESMILKASELADPPKSTAQRNRKGVRKLLIVDTDRQTFNDTNHEIAKGGLYVNLYDGDPIVDRTRTFRSFFNVIANAKRVGIIDKDAEVFGINSTHKDIPSKNPGWVCVVDLLKAEIAANEAAIAELSANEIALASCHSNSYMEIAVQLKASKVDLKKTDSLIWDIYNTVHSLDQVKDTKIGVLLHAANRLSVSIPTVPPTINVSDLFQKADDKYPLLHVMWNSIYSYKHSDDKFIKGVAHYIDLADAA